MGCYRVWARGRVHDFHKIRIGIETTGESLVIEPETASGDDAARLRGFLFDVAGGARLPEHDCPGESDYVATMEAFCGSREPR